MTGKTGFQVLTLESFEIPSFMTFRTRYQGMLAQKGEMRFTVIEIEP